MAGHRFVWTCVLAALLCGCQDSQPDPAAAAAPAATAAAVAAADPAPAKDSAYDKVAAQAHGFSVGTMMASRVVYVFFDAQCPHCGRLWRASQPLLNQLRMVWIPVRFLGDLSGRQGAAMLAAQDPAQAMAQHEDSMFAGKGGIAAPKDLSAELSAQVKANTALLGSIGGGAVPFLVYKNPLTGQSATLEGETDTAGLKKLLALN